MADCFLSGENSEIVLQDIKVATVIHKAIVSLNENMDRFIIQTPCCHPTNEHEKRNPDDEMLNPIVKIFPVIF
jgi:hypothetical protein